MEDVLTQREMEVLNKMCDGLSNIQIANLLHISLNTIKNHFTNIHKKLDTKSRTQLVIMICSRNKFSS